MNENDPQTFAIIGAAMEVHKELGYGFLESVYQDALTYELKQRGVPFMREQAIPVIYKGLKLDSSFRADFVCFDSEIVELKAIKVLSSTEEAQVINYLKATGFTRALLLNFGSPRLDFKRLVHEHPSF